MNKRRIYEVVLKVEVCDPSRISGDVAEDIAIIIEGEVIATDGPHEAVVTRVLDARHSLVSS